jgi:hypothetical protein
MFDRCMLCMLWSTQWQTSYEAQKAEATKAQSDLAAAQVRTSHGQTHVQRVSLTHLNASLGVLGPWTR